MRPILSRLRLTLLLACLATAPAVAWRGVEVAAEMRRDRSAAAAYQRGSVLQMEGRYAEAAAAYREAIAASPRATGAYTALGDVEFKRGRIAQAVQAYRELMAIYPYTYLSELRRQVGLIELRGGLLLEAIEDLRQAVLLDPNDWLAFHLLGHAYDRTGDHESARAAWEQALLLNPEFQPSHEQIRRLNEQRP